MSENILSPVAGESVVGVAAVQDEFWLSVTVARTGPAAAVPVLSTAIPLRVYVAGAVVLAVVTSNASVVAFTRVTVVVLPPPAVPELDTTAPPPLADAVGVALVSNAVDEAAGKDTQT
ncbi:MAG: hypothetical protein M0Z87_04085 [Actinomycetota bacterium]|nr:hypothetical protein [Actinomycetota bacterium]